MPENIDIYQYSPVNNTTSWTSEITDVSSSRYVTFTAYCSENYDVKIEYSIESTMTDIIDTDIFNNTGSVMFTQKIPVKTQYMRFTIENIASTPNILCTSGFFWL